MSDDVKHPNLDDLLDGEDTGGDDVSTDESGTDTQEDVKPEDNKSDDQDSLLDESLKAEEAKNQFAEAWAKKIRDGKATLEDLKEKQAWLLPDVEQRLEPKADPDEVKKLASEAAQELFQREKQKELAEKTRQQFDDLKSKIKESNPSYEQRERLIEKFDSLKAKLDPYEALVLAAEVAQIDLDGSNKRRQSMVIARPTSARTRPQKKPSFDDVDPNSLSRDQLAEFVKSSKAR